jgi:hypothetical protein
VWFGTFSTIWHFFTPLSKKLPDRFLRNPLLLLEIPAIGRKIGSSFFRIFRDLETSKTFHSIHTTKRFSSWHLDKGCIKPLGASPGHVWKSDQPHPGRPRAGNSILDFSLHFLDFGIDQKQCRHIMLKSTDGMLIFQNPRLLNFS